MEFVKELAQRMGDRFHLYGRGFIEIDCKATAILPYSHHLVIENNAEDSFFTEKVCDAFLGWSLPVFSGSEDIEDFFPAESMIRFDMDAPDAIDRVVAALDVPVDAGRLAALAEARRRVLYNVNLFARLADILGKLEAPMAARRPTHIMPNGDFKNLRRRLKRQWWMLRQRFSPAS